MNTGVSPTSSQTASNLAALRRSMGQLRGGLSIILTSKTAVLGLAIALLWVIIAIFAPSVTRYGPLDTDYLNMDQPPSREHILGTDRMGRDVWSRVAYGARTILTLGPVSVMAGYALGIGLGLPAAYYGGWADEIIMRFLDTVMAFPRMLLFIIILSAFGASPANVVFAIAIGSAPGTARLVRALAIDVRTRDYISAARLRGDSDLTIMFREILPNCQGPLVVDFLLQIGYAAFAIGTLGFLGLGVPPPTPDWGGMVMDGRGRMMINIWPVLSAILAIASLVVGLNLFADGLHEETTRYK